MVIIFQNWTKSNYTSDFFLDTQTHTHKKGKIGVWVYVQQINHSEHYACVMPSLFRLFDFVSLSGWFFHTANPLFIIQIYMNKDIYIYSKLASRASYLYFLGLKYTVRCWQVPSTSSGFLAQLHLAFVNFKNKYRDLCVWDINDIYGLACNCILLNMQWTDP